jgi:hypothetical protein
MLEDVKVKMDQGIESLANGPPLAERRYVPSRNRRLNYVLGSQKGVINNGTNNER